MYQEEPAIDHRSTPGEALGVLVGLIVIGVCFVWLVS
jgi:hypothetical protein